MKYIKRVFKYITGLLVLLVFSCSAVRTITPTYIPENIRQLSNDAYHTWGGFTTLGIIDMDNKIIEAKYIALKVSIGGLTDLTEDLASKIVYGLGLLGMATGPVAYAVGKKVLDKNHVTKEQYILAGKMNPNEFKKISEV